MQVSPHAWIVTRIPANPSLQVAYECGRPVQPVAIWSIEPIGLAPETDALMGTAEMLRFPTQAPALPVYCYGSHYAGHYSSVLAR